MANRTAKDARSVKGTNPQYLVEKIIRTRIYDARYWKEECFGLTAELIVDKVSTPPPPPQLDTGSRSFNQSPKERSGRHYTWALRFLKY